MRRPNFEGFSTKTDIPPLGTRATQIAEIRRRRLEGALVLLVANSKGGPGKTTCALNIAVGYRLRGLRVLIVDTDIQQSTAKKWPRSPSFRPTVVSSDLRDVMAKLVHWIAAYDVVIVDTRGSDEPALALILPVCDILVAPSKPSHQDLPELERTIPVSEAHAVPHIVVFNEATREWTEELAGLAQEYSHFGPFLPVAMKSLVGYRHAYGKGAGVLEYRYEAEAKINFRHVFDALESVIEEARNAWKIKEVQA